MNKINLIACLASALLLAPVCTAHSQSNWQTIAEFQSEPFSSVDALAQDKAGNIYAAVSLKDLSDRRRAQVRMSSDRGATWTVADDFAPVDNSDTQYLHLGTDTAGQIYAAGCSTDDQGVTRWIVRKSGQGGRDWSTVDDFAWSDAPTTVAQGFAADAAGNLYVVGHGEKPPTDGKSSGRTHWLVRQSRDGGRTWSTIDDFVYQFSAKAAAILSTSNGLFVAGSGWNGKSESCGRWLVRKGTADGAGGLHWQTVDEFRLQEQKYGFDSRVQALATDARGNLYAVGRSYAAAEGAITGHWVTRRASSAGTGWQLVDRFQLNPGYFAAAGGVTVSDQAGVYVVGQALGNRPGSHWIVRQSATGDPGSWSLSDDFQAVLPASGGAKAGELILAWANGTEARTAPDGFSRGLAILSDAKQVYAGGIAYTMPGQALVRKLELGTLTGLAVASER